MASPVLTVNLVILTMAGPFLLSMILVYSLAPGSVSINSNRSRCVDSRTRLASVMRYIYEDSPLSFRYAGTAVIIGDRIAITIPQVVAVRDYYYLPEKFQKKFYLSSGSKFWYNEKSIQRIKDVTMFPYSYDSHGWATGEIVVFHTEEAFPNCTPAAKWLSVSSAPAPSKPDSSFLVYGWKEGLTRAYERYISESFDIRSPGSLPGGVIFKGNSFWGLMRTSVGQQEVFFERQEYERRMTNRTNKEERERMRLYVNFGEIFDDFKKRYPETKIRREGDKTGGQQLECGSMCPETDTPAAEPPPTTLPQSNRLTTSVANSTVEGS